MPVLLILGVSASRQSVHAVKKHWEQIQLDFAASKDKIGYNFIPDRFPQAYYNENFYTPDELDHSEKKKSKFLFKLLGKKKLSDNSISIELDNGNAYAYATKIPKIFGRMWAVYLAMYLIVIFPALFKDFKTYYIIICNDVLSTEFGRLFISTCPEIPQTTSFNLFLRLLNNMF